MSGADAKPAEVTIDGYPFTMYRINGRRRVNSYRLLKLYLVEKYKVCYWCGIEVKDYPHIEGVGLRDDAATIDHIIPRQRRKRFETVEKVLACYDCNRLRNEVEQRRGHKEAA